MITDEQLEEAARKICHMRGTDPDATIRHGRADGTMVLISTPLWKMVAAELRQFAMYLQVTQEYMQVPIVPGVSAYHD